MVVVVVVVSSSANEFSTDPNMTIEKRSCVWGKGGGEPSMGYGSQIRINPH